MATRMRPGVAQMLSMNMIVSNVVLQLTMPDQVNIFKQQDALTDEMEAITGNATCLGFSFMGKTFESKKRLQSFAYTKVLNAYPQLPYVLWEKGQALIDLKKKVESEQSTIRQLLFKHLTRVSKENPIHWLSSLPNQLTDELPKPLSEVQRVYDVDYFKPTEPTALAEWEKLMSLIYLKLALRLVV